MPSCFICGEEITSENKSEEHIFLNAIGGKLKSDKLICKKCNANMGDKMDAELAKQLQFFSTLLNVSRDRKDNKPITAIRKNNGEKITILPGGKPQLHKPKVKRCKENDKIIINVVARDYKELDRINKNIKKKHPNSTVISSGEEIEEIDEVVYVEFDVDRRGLLSLCKAAICYYSYLGKNQLHIQSLIDDFKSENTERCNFFYPGYKVFETEEEVISHSIALIGDSNKKLLYACIELFSFYKVIILMNDSYNGEEIKSVYSYDLISQKEVTPKLNIDLTCENIKLELSKGLEQYGKQLVIELNKTKRKIEVKNMIDRIIDEIYKENK